MTLQDRPRAEGDGRGGDPTAVSTDATSAPADPTPTGPQPPSRRRSSLAYPTIPAASTPLRSRAPLRRRRAAAAPSDTASPPDTAPVPPAAAPAAAPRETAAPIAATEPATRPARPAAPSLPPAIPDLGEVLRRVARQLAAGADLASALDDAADVLPRRRARRLREAAANAADQDPRTVLLGLARRTDRREVPWLAEAIAADAPLPVVTGVAARIVDERARMRRERRWFGVEAAVAAVGLPALPVVAAVVRQLLEPGSLTGLPPLRLALLLLAGVLTVTAAAWLARMSRPPYSPWPPRWRGQRLREARERALLDAVDRAAIAASAGRTLAEAVAVAREGIDDPAVQRAVDAAAARAAEADDPLQGFLAQGTRLRAQRLQRDSAQAAWVPLAALLPLGCCVLPATVLVFVV